MTADQSQAHRYGAFLNTVRRLFGLPKGGSKPMSLNTETGSP
jgi:hypothetical protein